LPVGCTPENTRSLKAMPEILADCVARWHDPRRGRKPGEAR
jgi:hypothetical protein